MSEYATIVADPPWPFVWRGSPGGRRANQTHLGYSLMTYGEIAAIAVGDIIAPQATLFLWVTQEALHSGEARRVAHAWGFPTRVGEFVWRKPNFGAGAYPRIGHELCVIYKRGRGSLRPDGPRNVHSVQSWRQDYNHANGHGKKHSAKPEEFYVTVMEGYEGPYVELFARSSRPGWDHWGNEMKPTAIVAA